MAPSTRCSTQRLRGRGECHAGSVKSAAARIRTSSPEGEIAAEECCRKLQNRGLGRHHAVADVLAFRASYAAVKAFALQLARHNATSEPFQHPDDEHEG